MCGGLCLFGVHGATEARSDGVAVHIGAGTFWFGTWTPETWLDSLAFSRMRLWDGIANS